MTEAALALERPPEEIEYPESDGEPMAETDVHRDELAEIVFTLQHHFRGQNDVYVSGNLFLYYEEGDPGKRRAPDVFVVRGVPSRQRRTYRLWEEGKAPVMAIELTSKGTKTEDVKTKPEIYARLGIEYLFLYDVLGEYLKPPLQGLRLGRDGKYHSLAGPRQGPLPCPPLALDLILDEQGRLQFVDRETEEPVVRTRAAREQAEEARRQAEEARRQAEEAREQAEERVEQAEEARRQEAEARRQAEERAEQGLRRKVEDLCGLLGIEWSSERSTVVAGMGLAQLEALWADLLNHKRWP